MTFGYLAFGGLILPPPKQISAALLNLGSVGFRATHLTGQSRYRGGQDVVHFFMNEVAPMLTLNIEPWEVGAAAFGTSEGVMICVSLRTWVMNITAGISGHGLCRPRARRQPKRAVVEIVPRQCAAMESIDAATTRGDTAMWYWVAAVVSCSKLMWIPNASASDPCRILESFYYRGGLLRLLFRGTEHCLGWGNTNKPSTLQLRSAPNGERCVCSNHGSILLNDETKGSLTHTNKGPKARLEPSGYANAVGCCYSQKASAIDLRRKTALMVWDPVLLGEGMAGCDRLLVRHSATAHNNWDNTRFEWLDSRTWALQRPSIAFLFSTLLPNCRPAQQACIKSRPGSARRTGGDFVCGDLQYSGELVRFELGSLGLILMFLLQLPLPTPLLANSVASTVQEEVAHEGEC
ncbi:hypothetical protein DFH06DRAFT_1136911 [Mycena polygramma]|nr:hypothetical protein DFH06DRAFT_1136911 [Mycena polygramma]